MRRHSRTVVDGGGGGPSLESEVAKNHEVEKDLTKTQLLTQKRNNFIKDYIIDYTANSNLHGLRYIGEKDRTLLEKIFWMFMFTCCIVFCALWIEEAWLSWKETPVIVSFAESSTPVYEIPYPAVTVCFETKIMQSKFNFTEHYHLYLSNQTNLSDEIKERFEDVSLVCDADDKLVLELANGRKFTDGLPIVNNLQMVTPNITEMFSGCLWQDAISSDCAYLFSPILTEEGQCYTFNTLGAEQLFRTENLHKEYQYLENINSTQSWTLEDGYLPNTDVETYPHRGLGFGVNTGLTFVLNAKEIDLDYVCKGPVQGFKILLHNPAEMPRIQQFFRSPLSQEVMVAVKPKIVTTSEGLSRYDLTRRQCYFSSERYLQYFKVYTQANCDMECLTNFTYARCGCVPFGIPLELVTAALTRGSSKTGRSNDTLGEANAVASRCKCLPACTSMDYEVETSQADFDHKALFKAFGGPTEEHTNNSRRYARVRIFFKEAQFISSRRSEHYRPVDFLANCGGILSLFMGFSILSVAEILYFLTLRLFCVIWRRRRSNEEDGPVEDLAKGTVGRAPGPPVRLSIGACQQVRLRRRRQSRHYSRGMRTKTPRVISSVVKFRGAISAHAMRPHNPHCAIDDCCNSKNRLCFFMLPGNEEKLVLINL